MKMKTKMKMMMKKLGWEPAKSVRERIGEVTKWTLDNERWIQL